MRQLLLGINVDHVATIREARGGASPDLLAAAKEAIAGGADSITVHLREDRRHIQDRDVQELHATLQVPLNLEMSMTEDIVQFAESLMPPHVCLVPENRLERTTESGLDVCGNKQRVAEVCTRMHAGGSEVSLFLDPVAEQVKAAAGVGATAIELHTGDYANSSGAAKQQMLQQLREAAALAQELGLRVYAGHGLDVDNVAKIAAIECVVGLNIGYSVICRAVFCGIRNAVKEIKAAMQRPG